MENGFPDYIFELENMLLKLFRAMKEKHVQEAAELKMSMPQFVCLWVISKFDKFKMSELASYLALSYASATNLVNRLVDAGFVIRYDHPDDRRVVMVELTEKGRKIIHDVHQKHLSDFRDNCKKLSHEEIQTMLKGLEILTESVYGD